MQSHTCRPRRSRLPGKPQESVQGSQFRSCCSWWDHYSSRGRSWSSTSSQTGSFRLPDMRRLAQPPAQPWSWWSTLANGCRRGGGGRGRRTGRGRGRRCWRRGGRGGRARTYDNPSAVPRWATAAVAIAVQATYATVGADRGIRGADLVATLRLSHLRRRERAPIRPAPSAARPPRNPRRDFGMASDRVSESKRLGSIDLPWMMTRPHKFCLWQHPHTSDPPHYGQSVPKYHRPSRMCGCKVSFMQR